MKSEFLIAIGQLSAEKNLPRAVVFQAVEEALASAYRKDNLAANRIQVKINPETGEVRVFAIKEVIEEVEDPHLQVSLEEASRLHPGIKLGQEVELEVTPKNAGRIAAQTAKQVVLQRLREAEREVVYEEFSERESDILSGVVQRVEAGRVILDLGKTEAVLPASEQVRAEHYRPGQRLKVYVLEVLKSSKGPQVVVSRTHKSLLRRLFELEVPEIFKGTVELKAIAREPGYRSKVAVYARQGGVDPVGACVGLRGIRIQNIVNELNGERIDVVEWDPEPSRFVANALSPAHVTAVRVDPATNTASVIAPDRMLSLAIGKEGQNARLAAKLTGWRIDIKSQSVAEELRLPTEPEPAPARTVPGVSRLPAEAEPIPAAPPLEPLAVPSWAPAAPGGEPTPGGPGETAEEMVAAVAEPAPPGVDLRGPVRFAEEIVGAPSRSRKAKARPGREEEEEGRPKQKRPKQRQPLPEEELGEYEEPV